VRLFRLTLIALLFGAASLCAAQEHKPSPEEAKADSFAKPPEEKTEFERAAEELKKRGETVLTVCADDDCKDPKRKITGGVVNGKAIELVQPAYPAIARASRASGKVEVAVIIDKEGEVMAAEVRSGHPLLWAAAYRAAKASRFSPTMLDDKPVNVMGLIIYNFVAQ
jgi:TonB family protein